MRGIVLRITIIMILILLILCACSVPHSAIELLFTPVETIAPTMSEPTPASSLQSAPSPASKVEPIKSFFLNSKDAQAFVDGLQINGRGDYRAVMQRKPEGRYGVDVLQLLYMKGETTLDTFEVPCLPFPETWCSVDLADVDADGTEEALIQVNHNTSVAECWTCLVDYSDGSLKCELMLFSDWPFWPSWAILPEIYSNEEWREMLLADVNIPGHILDLYTLQKVEIQEDGDGVYLHVLYQPYVVDAERQRDTPTQTMLLRQIDEVWHYQIKGENWKRIFDWPGALVVSEQA